MSNTDNLTSVLDVRRRLASPNERRVIARQDIGHQRRLVVGTVYASDAYGETLRLDNGKQPFLAALAFCVDEHPLLSTVILNADTEHPEFATPKTLDLEAHLEIRHDWNNALSEDKCIEKLFAQLSDEKFTSLHTTPPWKVVLVSMCVNDTGKSRIIVLYTNYHSHGDGRSGLAFQSSFHKGLSNYLTESKEHHRPVDPSYIPSNTPLLPPIEEGGKLTLSWSYLLSPLLGAHLPESIASLLGLRTSWLTSESDIWRGRQAKFDPENHSTGLVLMRIEPATMSRVLQHCRANRTTFTGALKHLIARSLNAPDGGAVATDAFNTGVAIDMRHLFEGRYSAASMMNCVTGHSEMVQYDYSQEKTDWAINPTSRFWESARKTTASLKVAAGTLHDQPIGLLQYLRGFRSWTTGQIGKERDMSFEISNLGAFTPEIPHGGAGHDLFIETAVFSQPAKASGSLLDFNPVSVKGGPLVMTVTWQLGVLDLPDEAEETDWVRKMCAELESSIHQIAAIPV